MDEGRLPARRVEQVPAPGASMVSYCGDTFAFSLCITPSTGGKAFVRTNLGSASVSRKEIINRVEKNEIKLGEAWYDIPMADRGGGRFEARLPLTQTGYFQAKCFFLPEGSDAPVWQDGGNTVINVEPAGTCCANIIYNAFVRQFGPSKFSGAGNPSLGPLIETLDRQGYTVIPGSGKFRDLKEQVSFIFSRMGCRALHLLPIHPTPTTYARMGRFGSPYAALDFTDVDPALAEFDPAATPLEQFTELLDAVHEHMGYLILDIAINHTGWAASIHESHPEWLDREDSGRIREPGAWGVVWADLTRLDYRHTDLWQYMADVFLLWCHRGVDGFRCDAGYMIPEWTWEYIISKVREEYPDTLFFLEGLGGPPDTTRRLLGPANFNWAYSELFQEYSLESISRYLPLAVDISETLGSLIHFAETHDNERLAKTSRTYARMRTGLCALFSVCGGFGFANGVEWFATEKINVHESPGLNWDSPDNQVDYISRLNLILREHPAFFSGAALSLVHDGNSRCLALLRRHGTRRVLVLVNPACDHGADASWPAGIIGETASPWFDLITGDTATLQSRNGAETLALAPGAVLALVPDRQDLSNLDSAAERARAVPPKVLAQKRRALALSVITAVNGYGDLGGLDVEAAGADLARDPLAFIRGLNPDTHESRVILFDTERDVRRLVMVPPGFFLWVRSPVHFRAELLDTQADRKSLRFSEGLPSADGTCFHAIFMPRAPKDPLDCLLKFRCFDPGRTRAKTAHIRYLAPLEDLSLRLSFTRREIAGNPSLKQLSATNRGGMMRAAANFGKLESRYDALLGANLSPDLPEDRWMLLSRFRIWAVYQGYSRELTLDCLQAFWASFDRGGKWRFRVPTSEGRYYVLVLYLTLDRALNRVVMTVHREVSLGDDRPRLADTNRITLIIRPDIEDRSFHDTVKAFTGPETLWPTQVSAFQNGFFFTSQKGPVLRVSSAPDGFFQAPEWQYMVHRALEATRGLETESDLFSPGYFSLSLGGGDRAAVEAVVLDEASLPDPVDPEGIPIPGPFESTVPLSKAFALSVDAFLIDRGQGKSVIAGFPWFLDWGRDSLIFCRCLTELGRFEEATKLLALFGRFEKDGTLPNMICGENAQNIETSDAPLWFFACCRQLAEALGDGVLDLDIGGRPLRTVLIGMAHSMIRGTPTGVKADPSSLLLYSPSHFTWMDTNFPAGTPRQGYPVEIQALWYHALDYLSRIDDLSGQGQWRAYAGKVRQSILELFWQEDSGYFSDCLHCDGFAPAAAAAADDALRPNQLLLITLGAVGEESVTASVVEACLELLVPGAIRSLADRPVTFPQPVTRDGQPLNDPAAPYIGTYEGDEDTKRKPAYHNGTAWTWQFPVFCEAWAEAFGPSAVPSAQAWLGSAQPLMRTGCAGYVPEILDGDFPHRPRGCDAQAWGASELARVAHKLTRLLKR